MSKLLSGLIFLVLAAGVFFPDAEAQEIPVPNPAQLRYQQYEQIMFLCLDPCTWQGREYDNHSIPLSRINPTELNTDQWCQAAQSWGARLILFVAKHTGGFCWWNTETSDYGVRNIPWRNGKGDVLADLSESCRKFGLGLGIYVYPGDDTWGAGLGSGGKTSDPARQEGYNQVFRQQMAEVLTKYGPVQEVWFDGSCLIDVSDILKTHASDAVILQGPMANIRWVGNEQGIAPYPNWYTVKRADLATGVSTALHSDPLGDAYAPVEMDVPLLKVDGHKWFWAPNTEKMLPSTDHLMDLYYRSVGRGGVLLLNATPDTSGLIPASHLKVYADFGNEIRRRFAQPVKSITSGDQGLILSFEMPARVNHVVIQENLAAGQRIRRYIIEGEFDGQWKKIREGSSVGQKRIESFEAVLIKGLRLAVIGSAGPPDISNFSAFNVSGYKAGVVADEAVNHSATVGSWNSETFTSEWKEFRLDLTAYLTRISQYELKFETISNDWTKKWGLEFKDAGVEMYGKDLPQAVEQMGEAGIFRITRSQQTDKPDEFPTVFRVKVRSKPGKSMGNIDLKRIVMD